MELRTGKKKHSYVNLVPGYQGVSLFSKAICSTKAIYGWHSVIVVTELFTNCENDVLMFWNTSIAIISNYYICRVIYYMYQLHQSILYTRSILILYIRTFITSCQYSLYGVGNAHETLHLRFEVSDFWFKGGIPNGDRLLAYRLQFTNYSGFIIDTQRKR